LGEGVPRRPLSWIQPLGGGVGEKR